MKFGLLVLFLTSLSFTSVNASARDKAGNGGDEVGLRFQASAATAFGILDANALTAAQKIAFNTELSAAKYAVVEDDLFAKLPDAVQNSVAINLPAEHLIYVNRQRWSQLKPVEQLQIALHEVLGLIGVEGTGDYHISMRLSPPTPEQIPGSLLLYSLDYDESEAGLTKSAAEKTCTLQRAIFLSDYKVVYCAYLEKPLLNGHLEPLYGIKIFGFGFIQPGASWRVLFSSLNATVPGLFATANEAHQSCAVVLADASEGSFRYLGARCFTEPQDGQFFYEIKTNVQN